MISTALGEMSSQMLLESFIILIRAGMDEFQIIEKDQLVKKSTRAPQQSSNVLVSMIPLVLQSRPLRFKHIGPLTQKLVPGPVDVPPRMSAAVVEVTVVGCRLGDLMVLESPMTLGG